MQRWALVRGKEVEHVAGREVRITQCVAHDLRDAIEVAVDAARRRAPRICAEQLARDLGKLAGALPALALTIEDHVGNDLAAALVERAPVRLLRATCSSRCARLLRDACAPRDVRRGYGRARRQVRAVGVDLRKERESRPERRIEQPRGSSCSSSSSVWTLGVELLGFEPRGNHLIEPQIQQCSAAGYMLTASMNVHGTGSPTMRASTRPPKYVVAAIP